MAPLSRREWLCCMLLADGHLHKEIALVLGISEWTAGGYLRRAREKYAAAGIDVGDRIRLRRQLIREGHLSEVGVLP